MLIWYTGTVVWYCFIDIGRLDRFNVLRVGNKQPFQHTILHFPTYEIASFYRKVVQFAQ